MHSTRAPQTTKIATGNLVDGRYLVGEIIGTGAFGLVFEAKNVELDEKVALKTMRPEIAVDTAMVARFAREAKAAASIKSEYVATVYDVGTGADGLPYIVMEYLHGQNLGELVEKSGPIAPQKAVEYALQICEALAVAHSKGIVHRDIKPDNLLLTERAGGMHIVKVLDFGISKAALTGSIFGDELPIVKTVNLMGTPLYMSPEQVRCSDHVDLRSDIWSLGMVLYEIIAGTTAFEGASITEICAAILEHTPTPLEVYSPSLPSGLADVITRCLEKDVRNRYQNVAELALALMPFAPKRSRLNVERAVAVLQSAGQVDPDLKVESAMPPVSVESLQAEALLRASLSAMPTSAPGLSTLASTLPPGTSSSSQPAAPSAAPAILSTPASGAPSSNAPVLVQEGISVAPPQKSRKAFIAVAGLALAALAFGGGMMLRRPGAHDVATRPADTVPVTAATTLGAATTPVAAAPITTAAAVTATATADDKPAAAAKAMLAAPKAAPGPWPPSNPGNARRATAAAPASSPAAPPSAATPPSAVTPAASPAPPQSAATAPTPADTSTGRTFRHSL